MINVAAAIIEDGLGHVLLAQRSEPEHLRGLWEFPGGKVENGESFSQALLREIEEELALKIRVGPFLGEFPFHFRDGGSIHIQAFVAKAVGRDFQIIEHLDVRWVPVGELAKYTLSPADEPVLQAYLRLNPAP